jgi:phosphatidylserine/phosphatidylglycerophosphate/cardiolipin synthase-like enzyme
MLGSGILRAGTEVYFSPNGGAARAVARAVEGAKKSVHAAVFCFTEREIAQALLAAHRRGVDVKVVLGKEEKENEFSKLNYLLKGGIDVRIDSRSGLMHDKFAVVDTRIVITGSFNWTASAETMNRENLLVLDDEGLAKKYEKEFWKIWKASGPAAVVESEKPPPSAYVGNKGSMCFHRSSCESLPALRNRVYFDSREEALKKGCHPCPRCKP